MARLLGVAVLMVATMSGCIPSRAAKSAGEIGCAPEDITISKKESHLGLLQSGETWVAECNGRTFFCSQINQSAGDKNFIDSLLASEQVSCREAVESPQAERNRLAREAAAAELASRPRSAAPAGAAGFNFGETPEEAAARCTAAGHAWLNVKGGFRCSGPAVPLGIAASVQVQFCDGRACSIAVEHVPRTHWSRSSVALKTNLEAKYGAAQMSSGGVPESCRSEQAFTQCLQSRQLTLSYGWRWAAGESLEMSVGTPNGTEGAAIRLVYRRPRGAANGTAL